MILLAFTIVVCILTTALMVYGTSRYGWSNFLLIPIAMMLASLILGVVGYLA